MDEKSLSPLFPVGGGGAVVTNDWCITYSKNGGNLGLVLKMKNIACLSILLTKHVKYTYLFCLNLFYTVLQHLKRINKSNGHKTVI